MYSTCNCNKEKTEIQQQYEKLHLTDRWAYNREGLYPRGAYNRNSFFFCLQVDGPITGGS